ncbi:MAG TPA: hypothetical protein VN085_00150 [Vicinamibacterales bacterium]|nr:hypothetical protein [Vicinamibacterales bacterium]
MPTSILHIIGALSVAMATTPAIPTCSANPRQPAAPHNTISTAALATAGPGLPADFPIPPGLTPCKPLDASGEIICDWHGVADGVAIYKWYLEALPKAAYTLLPNRESLAATLKALPPDYHGFLSLGFKKGSAQGAVTIVSGKLSIQYLPHQ